MEDYVRGIEEHELPCLTKQGIADQVGVSRQTIHNHRKELEAVPRVRKGKVGKATVYWVVEEETEDESMGGEEWDRTEPTKPNQDPEEPDEDSPLQLSPAIRTLGRFSVVYGLILLFIGPVFAHFIHSGTGFFIIGIGLILLSSSLAWKANRTVSAWFRNDTNHQEAIQ